MVQHAWKQNHASPQRLAPQYMEHGKERLNLLLILQIHIVLSVERMRSRFSISLVLSCNLGCQFGVLK